jgi:CubicO group peptidase (beta-lactamase class C family)
MLNRRWTGLLLAVALAVAACAHQGTPAPAPPVTTTAPGVAAKPAAASASARHVFPGASWEKIADPQPAGYCQDKLELVTARAKELPTTAMMAVVGGRVVYEYGDQTTVSYLASVRKSVLAMLYGNYVASGKIRLDRTLADLKIDDHGGLLPIEKQATVADLLGARSGVYHEASNAGDNLADAPPRGSQKPGTYFLYSNWDFNALGTIFEQETGQNIYDALERDLVKPIGMQDFDRSTHRRNGDAKKSIHLAYHMNFSTRDMARLGYLMLREGNWNGQQLVPRDWSRKIVSVITPVHQMNPANVRKGPFGYGYLWWVWDGPAAIGPFEGAYSGRGAIGQYITVLPKLDLVIAHKTRPGGQSVSWGQYMELVDRLVAARCDG